MCTLRGAGQLAADHEYLPVRRLALPIEEHLYLGSQWVVLEPKDESLWAQIRLNVGAFMARAEDLPLDAIALIRRRRHQDG